MDEILKLISQADQLLSKMSVSGDNVLILSNARICLIDASEKIKQKNKEE